MATARLPRQPRRGRERRAPARIPSRAVRAAQAPDVLPLVLPVEAAIGEDFDRAIALVMREIDPILQAYGARRDELDAVVRQDAFSLQELFGLIDRIARLPAAELLRRLFGRVQRQVTEATIKQLPTIPLEAVISHAPLQQAAWVRQNTELIKSPEPIKREIERLISRPLVEGRRVEVVRAELQERLGMSKRRAQLIARDQTLKAAGQLQEARQRQAGITRYVWTTSLDERVREDHELLEGTIHSWDDPPIVDRRTGRRAHPGGDFQCRCTAAPVLDDPSFEPTEE